MNRSRTELTAASLSLPQTSGRWQRLRSMEPGTLAGAPEGKSEDGQAHRCTCGSLLARLVASGVELKCRRCKRIVLLPFHTERPR
jgi:hypothetical protein